jgi:LuxR family transcriptional regulator, quorum-sensing system regulator SolR
MFSSTREAVRRVQDTTTLEEYRVALGRAVNDFGFEFFAFGIRMPFPLTAPEFGLVTNYPARWQEQYQACRYLSIDPTVRHGLRSVSPVLWSSFDEEPYFWEEARGFGLHHGWAQPSRGLEGTVGMLTLSRSGDSIQPDEVAEKLPILTLMSVVAHDVFTRIATGAVGPAASSASIRREPAESSLLGGHLTRPELQHPRKSGQLDNARLVTALSQTPVQTLTAREVEVLRWTAEGKISMDISDILGITERTVNFHIGNCMRKLGATSKTSAAVQAALWGLL